MRLLPPKIRLLYVIILLNVTMLASLLAQDDYLSPDDLLADLDQLMDLIDAHPDPYAYTSESKFNQAVTQLRTDFQKPQMKLEAYKKMSALLALIKDGHTKIFLPAHWYHKKLDDWGTFPFEVHLTNEDELYILKNYSHHNIPTGAKILSINDWTITEIIDHIDQYISYERKTFRNTLIDNDFNHFLNFCFGFREHHKIKYIHSTTEEITVLNIPYKNWEKAKRKEIDKRTKQINNGRPYAFEKIENIGILHLYSFEIDNYDAYDHFLRKAFKEIKHHNIQSLIIDIRDNYGGCTKAPLKLLHYISNYSFNLIEHSTVKISHSYKSYCLKNKTYLIKSPYFSVVRHRNFDLPNIDNEAENTYLDYEAEYFVQPKLEDYEYSGDCYLLTNRDSYSAATCLASTFQCYRMGMIIGAETGGTKILMGNPMFENLKHSQFTVCIATTIIYNNCHENEKYSGVKPNVVYEPTVLDLLAVIDVHLMYAIRIIKKVKQGNYDLETLLSQGKTKTNYSAHH